MEQMRRSNESYPEFLERLLTPREDIGIHALDLFAGCGGLALGFEARGFSTTGFEMDSDACDSYRKNLVGACVQVVLTEDSELPEADVIIGGPPCQPFSVGGKQAGAKDDRNGLPAFIAAVRQIRPSIWLFENVRGLFYRNRWYLEEVLSELRSLGYQVDLQLLNAKHHGVPQNRERVIVVGHAGNFRFPEPLDELTSAGDALGQLAHEIPPGARFLTPSMDAYIAKYEKASKCVNPRDLDLSRPARTLTCRNLAGATGDMQRVRLSDGSRRRLTLREAARLQSFPDSFEFVGGERSALYQCGNAVPPVFAYRLADRVARALAGEATPEPSEEGRLF